MKKVLVNRELAEEMVLMSVKVGDKKQALKKNPKPTHAVYSLKCDGKDIKRYLVGYDQGPVVEDTLERPMIVPKGSMLVLEAELIQGAPELFGEVELAPVIDS